MVRLLLIIVALTLSSTTWCQSAVSTGAETTPAQTSEPLTLNEAIALALQGNPTLKRAALEVHKSADQYAALRTRLLPVFEVNAQESQLLTRMDFNFAQGIFGTYPTIGPLPGTNTRITSPRLPTLFLYARATQPITQLRRLKLGLQMEEVRGEISREKLRSERQHVVKEVKQTYYELLRLQAALTATEKSIKLYNELDRTITQYVVEKVALKSDGLEIKAKLAAEEYTALTLRNATTNQKEYLNLLLGRELQTNFVPTPFAETALFETDLVTAQTRALENHPDIKEARLQIRQAELDQRIKKSQAIPDISIAASYLHISPISVIPRNIASIGVSLTWEPFDWGRRKYEVAEKAKVIEQGQRALEATEARIKQETRMLFRQLQEARAFLRVTQLAQDAAQEKLRVMTVRYTEQSALLQDVLQTQAAQAEAQQKYQQALLSFWKVRAALEKAVGED